MTRSSHFRKGQKVILSEDGIENYGKEYRGRVLHIRQWFDHEISLTDFFTSRRFDDPHGHPGFDSAPGDYLYEFVEECGLGALYAYELEVAPKKWQ